MHDQLLLNQRRALLQAAGVARRRTAATAGQSLSWWSSRSSALLVPETTTEASPPVPCGSDSKRYISTITTTATKSSAISLGISSTKLLAPAPPTTTRTVANGATTTTTSRFTCRRTFASGGTRSGARGHGWYIKYREGRSLGRRNDDRYDDTHDEGLQLDNERKLWNTAVLGLGSRRFYLDVEVSDLAAVSTGQTQSSAQSPALEEGGGGGDALLVADNETAASSAKKTTARHRLAFDVASTVLPETTGHLERIFGDGSSSGYRANAMRLKRFEKQVGWCTGVVGGVNGGIRINSSRVDLGEDPMPLWHTEGSVSILVPRVGSVDFDTRLILCTNDAPHLDGIHRCIGQLSPESLSLLQEWQSSFLTRYGVPISVDLAVTDCGLEPE